MPAEPPPNLVRWACVGLGGYAGKMSDLLWDLSRQSKLRYVAACDPALEANAERVAQLRSGDVRVHDNISALLRSDAQAVWLPVPIDLHLPFSRAVLEAGKAVLCEKPAAGAPHDIDAMIAARDAAALPLAVGFQHVYDPAVAEVKRRLRAGAVGTVRRASVIVAWPRDDHYYARNTWAARWKRGDTWVLDSPANNAMAHYLHLALFLLGDAPGTSAVPARVQAEHYRANPIETYDTTALRVTLTSGVELHVYLTHASANTIDPRLTFTGDAGTLVLDPEQQAVCPDATTLRMATGPEIRQNMVATVSALVRGERPPTPVATLECARAQSVTVAASVQAAPVQTFPAAMIRQVPTRNGTLRAVDDIESLLRDCAATHRLPSETGAWPWASPAQSIDVAPGWHFTGPHASR